jgi:selenocysteine-specific elongation factor
MRSPDRLVGCPGDRFVLRAFSPATTIGGGMILDTRPRRHKGHHPEVGEALEVLDTGGPPERLQVFLAGRGPAGIDPEEAQAALGVPLEDARNLLQGAVRAGAALVTDRRAQRHHHARVVAELEQQALDVLGTFHAEHPLKRGFGVEELRTKFPRYIDPKVVEFVLARLADEDRVVIEGDLVRRSDFALQLSADDEDLRRRILQVLDSRGYEGPSLEEAATALGQEPAALGPVLGYLVGEGVLTRTKEGFYFQSERLEELAGRVVVLFRERDEIGVADIKNITGTTRKYTIPLLEYLDARKITARRGDVRVSGPKGKG